VIGAFIFRLFFMGIEQGAISNSPVDCLCDAATSVSEAIGTGSAETNSHHPLQKLKH